MSCLCAVLLRLAFEGGSRLSLYLYFVFERAKMPKFLDGPQLANEIKTSLASASKAHFAVAFWGDGAAETLGINSSNGSRIHVVCNLLSGGTNPKEIRQLQNFGVKIRQLNDLHAKVGVVGGFSFLGSSNMSSNGLGDEGSETGWQEANVAYSRERPEIVAIIESYWEKASEIKEADLEKAELAWSTRKKGNAASKAQIASLSIVEMLRTQPGVLDDLNVRMVAYEKMTDPEELAALDAANRQAKDSYGSAFEVFCGWDSLVTEASQSYLVDFFFLPTGRSPVALCTVAIQTGSRISRRMEKAIKLRMKWMLLKVSN